MPGGASPGFILLLGGAAGLLVMMERAHWLEAGTLNVPRAMLAGWLVLQALAFAIAPWNAIRSRISTWSSRAPVEDATPQP